MTSTASTNSLVLTFCSAFSVTIPLISLIYLQYLYSIFFFYLTYFDLLKTALSNHRSCAGTSTTFTPSMKMRTRRMDILVLPPSCCCLRPNTSSSTSMSEEPWVLVAGRKNFFSSAQIQEHWRHVMVQTSPVFYFLTRNGVSRSAVLVWPPTRPAGFWIRRNLQSGLSIRKVNQVSEIGIDAALLAFAQVDAVWQPEKSCSWRIINFLSWCKFTLSTNTFEHFLNVICTSISIDLGKKATRFYISYW